MGTIKKTTVKKQPESTEPSEMKKLLNEFSRDITLRIGQSQVEVSGVIRQTDGSIKKTIRDAIEKDSSDISGRLQMLADLIKNNNQNIVSDSYEHPSLQYVKEAWIVERLVSKLNTSKINHKELEKQVTNFWYKTHGELTKINEASNELNENIKTLIDNNRLLSDRLNSWAGNQYRLHELLIEIKRPIWFVSGSIVAAIVFRILVSII